MTPRPLHRSLLFWLGVPGLIFCLWAWTRSNSRQTTFMAEIPPICYAEFTSKAGFLEYLFLASEPGTSPQFLSYDDPLRLDPSWLPPAIAPEIHPKDPFDTNAHHTRIAWWFITLIYTLLWLAMNATWRHHKHRQMKRIAIPPNDEFPASNEELKES
ncbi:hypothetical protein [Luteolibacter soli]|uniref:Transmembrane protein n=1 Tax=Luteolibacter soli TaxID=3135280 RepID=A0ABU9AV39_9BACT